VSFNFHDRALKKKTASSYRGGIGKATARLLAARGVHLALHYFSQHDGAIALVEELRASGVRAAAFQADLADFDAVRALHARVVEELGHPDIFYSNAAMAGTMLGIKAKIEDASLEEFERCWRANTGGAFLVSGHPSTSIPDTGVLMVGSPATVDPAVRPAHGKTRVWENCLLLQYCCW
jgi:NAD(P)-dependent dehydrogenase (short-subunit alcohol dehydrogenase family)